MQRSHSPYFSNTPRKNANLFSPPVAFVSFFDRHLCELSAIRLVNSANVLAWTVAIADWQSYMPTCLNQHRASMAGWSKAVSAFNKDEIVSNSNQSTSLVSATWVWTHSQPSYHKQKKAYIVLSSCFHVGLKMMLNLKMLFVCPKST